MKNYSRQRETILQVLRSTNTHPTASWIYQKVREIIPNISLGTVYRNLSGLAESGEILILNIGDGFEHFDGDASPHIHLHCCCCGGIEDARFSRDLIASISQEYGFTPKKSIYVVYGVCKKCKKSN